MSYRHFALGVSLLALAAGSAAAQSNTNTQQISQTGAGNNASVDNTVETNTGNSATVIQNGTVNSATIFQRGGFNRSFSQQFGSTNQMFQQQSGNRNNADGRQNGNFLNVAIAQVGDDNSATINQVGQYNTGTIRQGYALDASVPAGEFRSANRNVATVDQNGAGLTSSVGQRAASAAGLAASDNVATVTQRSSGNSSTVQQSSQIIQESRGNSADVTQLVGSVAAANSSNITQRNATAGASNPRSDNNASVRQDGRGLASQVTQDGFRNSATVRMAGGGDAAGQRNSATISQIGIQHIASLNVAPATAGRGTGNSATATQTGNEHRVDTYQFGIGDRSDVTQSNGTTSGTYLDGAQARGLAFVSQNGDGASSSIVQVGDNYAEVVQAFGSLSNTEISQTDAGENAGARAFNSAVVSQYGSSNLVDVDQNARGATASIWQKVGSANNMIELGQGTGGTALASTISNPGFLAGPTGAATLNLSATITQAGSYNEATFYQDGSNLRADSTQAGSGSASLRNIVFISQTGASNSASAVQNAGVGPSAPGDPASGNSAAQNAAIGEGNAQDTFYFAGGARSAEIRILQTNSGNSASVRQFGRGQLARIEQSGSNNIAGVVQEVLATNATSVIQQSGNSNSYYVVQTNPGQYIAVIQTGTANSATTTTFRGSGGSAGFTPPPGF